MDIRPADETDFAGIARVRLAIDSDAPHDDSGVDPAYCRFLVRSGRFLVAEDAGTIVGYGATVPVGPATLLADLFIDPVAQGRGVGRLLLEAALGPPGPRMTFASADPAAVPLYARAGMRTLWPLFYVRGPAEALGLARHFDTFEFAPQAAAVGDVTITGIDRSEVFAYWAGCAGTSFVVVQSGSEPIGVGVIRRLAGAVRVERLSVIRSDDALDALAALARFAQAVELVAYVPGSLQLSVELLRRGFRIDDHDLFMATDEVLVGRHLAVVHPGLC